MLKNEFKDYLQSTTSSSSKKASSYVRALDMLGEILEASSGPFSAITDLWVETSVEKVDHLYSYILEQQKSGKIFNTDHAPSYWENKFYSAALKSYRHFLVEHNYAEKLLTQYDGDTFDAQEFDLPADAQQIITQDFEHRDGKDVIRQVKTRVGQSVFRKKVLEVYDSTCCITGLNIPELNRASHIIPWSENKETRLDPRNGLCLSATFDAAFDRYLISLDENLRIILSAHLQAFFSKEVVKEFFLPFEGKEITRPTCYNPKDEYLLFHRAKLR